MAMVFVGFLTLLADAGLGAAVVQATELNDHRLRSIWGVVILVNCVLFALLALAAPAIALLFAEERLVPIIRVLAVQFLIGMFAVMPGALLTRVLDFKGQSIVTLVGALVGSLTTLSLAISGWGVWALVLGNLLAHFVNTVALNVISPFLKFPRCSLKGVRSMVVFGGQVTAARVLWFVYSQADVLIVGRLLGKELLGLYSVAMHLASLPNQKISSVLNQVALPAFAHSQHNSELVGRYLLRALRVLALVSFPIFWGLSSIAPEIIAVLLGTKWAAATVPLQLLPLIMPLSLLSPFLHTAFLGIGRGDVVLANVATACLVMPGAFALGANYGLAGVSLAWVIAFPFVMAFNLRRMLPLVGLGWRDFLSAVTPAAGAASVMYGAVSAARYFLADALSEPFLLVGLIVIGAFGYAGCAWATNKKAIEEISEFSGFRRGISEPEVSSTCKR